MNKASAPAAMPEHPPATNEGQPVLSMRNVVRRFGENTALRGVSLQVHAGEVLCLLGPNGAGKSTAVEICEGFQSPDGGEVRVFGLDPVAHSEDVRGRIGVMLQGGGAYPGIRVEEMLRLVASYSADPLDVEWLLATVGLTSQRRRPYRRLSGGQQQRLALACALVGRPELVFLDEPTAGLDAQSRLLVWDLIGALRADGVAVVLTTHLLDEAEALADYVVIIDRGEVVLQGTPAELTRAAGAHGERSGQVRITVHTDGPVDEAGCVRSIQGALGVSGRYEALDLDAASRDAGAPLSDSVRASGDDSQRPPATDAASTAAVDARPGIQFHRERPGVYALTAPESSPALVAALASAVAEQGVLITDFSTNRASLEDVFLTITGRSLRP